MTGRHLGDATWTALADERPIVVVPLGSCEQHGPHLPLDTDTRIAAALADRLAAARPGLVVAPPVAYGASWEHAGLPGLLSLDDQLLTAVLVELAHSADWTAGLVFVNGHGGNERSVRRAAATIVAEGRRAMAWAPRVVGGDAHAGLTETSLMLALDPGRVTLPLPPAGFVGPLTEIASTGVVAASPSGILGDPTGATAEAGRALLDTLATDLVAAFDRWVEPA